MRYIELSVKGDNCTIKESESKLQARAIELMAIFKGNYDIVLLMLTLEYPGDDVRLTIRGAIEIAKDIYNLHAFMYSTWKESEDD